MREIWIFAIVFLAGCASVGSEPEPSPTPPPRPSVEGLILINSEEYSEGIAYRFQVPDAVTQDELEEIVRYQGYTKGSKESELTFFFYEGRDPRDDQDWAADYIYEWYRGGGFRNCSDLRC